MPIPPPHLEFTLSPAVENRLNYLQVRVERLAQRTASLAFPPAEAEKALERWQARDWGYFDRGIGANRLINLLLNCAELHDDNRLFKAIEHAGKHFASRTFTLGLMAWCKLNWNSPLRTRYQAVLRSVASNLELFQNGKSRLTYGSGPLLPFLQDPKGDEAFVQWCEEQGGWEGGVQALKLAASEVSGMFFAASAKRYMLHLLESCPTSEFNEVVLPFLLSLVSGSLRESSLLPIAALAIVECDQRGVDHEGLMSFTMKHLGDVSDPIWKSVEGLSDLERSWVAKAEDVLEHWLNEMFLGRFWDLIADRRRQNYWRGKQRMMRNVRLAISEGYFQALPSDVKEGNYLKRLHSTTGNALLIFSIGDRVFIEFGDRASGPLQVIEERAQYGLKLNALLDRSQRGGLRVPFDPSVVKFYSATNHLLFPADAAPNPVGKMNHAGNWENRLDRWFRAMQLKQR